MNDMLKTDASIEEETDVLGGGNFKALPSDLYDMTIDTAYFDKSKGGAMSLNLQMSNAKGDNLRQTIYITSKAGRNFYMVRDKSTGKETGEKRYLPGFNVANALCLLTVGKEISDVATEEKTLKLYDFTQGKEVPQQRQVLISLLGTRVTLGIIKQIEDVNVEGPDGEWVASGKTRTSNEINKVFRASDGLTVPEIRAKSTTPEFRDKWLEKNKDTVNDRTVAQAGEQTAANTTATAATTTGTAPDAGEGSLFAQP